MRDIFLYSIIPTIRSNSLENKFTITVETEWFREEHTGASSRDHLYYFGYKMHRISPGKSISVSSHSRRSLEHRPESRRRKSYVVDLTDGVNRSQPPLTRHISKPLDFTKGDEYPWKKRNVSEHPSDGRRLRKNETRSETVGSTNKRDDSGEGAENKTRRTGNKLQTSLP